MAARQADRGEPLDWKTVECYQQTLTWWERIMPAMAVEQITSEDCDRFFELLRQQPGRRPGAMLSAATVRKHAANIRSLLRAAGTMAQVRMPRRPRKLPFGHLSLAEIAAIARAAGELRAPRREFTGVSVGEWWRNLIAWQYFTGCRIEETVLMRWEWVLADGEVNIPGEARKHGVPHVTFAHPQLLEWLQPQRAASRSPYVFAYCDAAKSDPRRRRQFIRRLTRAHEVARSRAGVRKVPGAAWHAYRKTHLTELAQVSLAAAQISSSHGGGGLLQGYYLDARRTLREGIAQLPVPQFDGGGHVASEG